jgi:hypothetical protein
MLLIPCILSLNYALTLSYRLCHIRTRERSRSSLGLVGKEEMESGYDGSISCDGWIWLYGTDWCMVDRMNEGYNNLFIFLNCDLKCTLLGRGQRETKHPLQDLHQNAVQNLKDVCLLLKQLGQG